MTERLRIGTRGSPLALIQAETVGAALLRAYPDVALDYRVVRTSGDRIQDRPLAEVGGKGLFTKEIEEALAAGVIDLAVHSSKDMPTVLPPGLVLSAFLKREDPGTQPDDETRTAVKAALADFMDAFQATMESGQMDGGAALLLSANKLTLVAGAQIKEPGKFESGLKKLAELAEKEPDFNGVQWNAANHEGVNFHTLSVPVPEDEAEARKMFGEKVDVAIGIGSEAVYVAVGQENLDAVNKAIDASKAEPNKEVPPFEFSASLGQFMEFAAANAKDEDKPMVQAIADMLKNDAQGRDHVRASSTLIENGQKFRFEAEEGVLRAIGKAAMMAQQKAQMEAMQAQ